MFRFSIRLRDQVLAALYRPPAEQVVHGQAAGVADPQEPAAAPPHRAARGGARVGPGGPSPVDASTVHVHVHGRCTARLGLDVGVHFPARACYIDLMLLRLLTHSLSNVLGNIDQFGGRQRHYRQHKRRLFRRTTTTADRTTRARTCGKRELRP